MQRILNDPDNIVDEMLSGFLKANSDIVEATENKRVVKARCKGEGKVGVITGGGSGHKPAFIGYVGENMCDAAAVGEICSGCGQMCRSGKGSSLSLWKLFRG